MSNIGRYSLHSPVSGTVRNGFDTSGRRVGCCRRCRLRSLRYSRGRSRPPDDPVFRPTGRCKCCACRPANGTACSGRHGAALQHCSGSGPRADLDTTQEAPTQLAQPVNGFRPTASPNLAPAALHHLAGHGCAVARALHLTESVLPEHQVSARWIFTFGNHSPVSGQSSQSG